MKYIFGANRLSIGSALIKIMDHLEKRYDLDFTELEKERREAEKNEENE